MLSLMVFIPLWNLETSWIVTQQEMKELRGFKKYHLNVERKDGIEICMKRLNCCFAVTIFTHSREDYIVSMAHPLFEVLFLGLPFSEYIPVKAGSK